MYRNAPRSKPDASTTSTARATQSEHMQATPDSVLLVLKRQAMRKSLDGYKKPALVERCKLAGLASTGTVKELTKRLVNDEFSLELGSVAEDLESDLDPIKNKTAARVLVFVLSSPLACV